MVTEGLYFYPNTEGIFQVLAKESGKYYACQVLYLSVLEHAHILNWMEEHRNYSWPVESIHRGKVKLTGDLCQW